MNLQAWLVAYLAPIVGVLLAILIGMLVLVVLLSMRLRRLERRLQELVSGTEGGNLEQVLEAHVREVRQSSQQVQELDELARRLERASRGHLQRVGFLRFNPFRDAGGDQSFVLALADADGNGVVVSSLHSRDATRVYGKPLAAWESVYTLTDEEKQSIDRARERG